MAEQTPEQIMETLKLGFIQESRYAGYKNHEEVKMDPDVVGPEFINNFHAHGIVLEGKITLLRIRDGRERVYRKGEEFRIRGGKRFRITSGMEPVTYIIGKQALLHVPPPELA